MKRFYNVFCMVACLAFAYSLPAQPAVSVATELRAFYDLSQLPAFRLHTISAQVSSYDTSGNNNDGFGGEYSFIRRNADSSLVIFDQKGPGVINRIWTPTPQTDTLDFYIDDTTHPAFSVSYIDLFTGKVYPFIAPLCGNQLGGYYCYFPIPFQRHCKIVLRAKHTQFHQVQNRLFAAGTQVKSYSAAAAQKAGPVLKKIHAMWNAEKAVNVFGNTGANKSVQNSFSLEPGETKTIANISTGGRITGIELTPALAFEGFDKHIILKAYWDDEILPAIEAPVADLFGYAFGKSSMQSLAIGTANGKLYCYFPMPFARKAKLELTYVKSGDGKQIPIPVSATVYYNNEPLKPATEGRLYVYRDQQQTPIGKPHVFVTTKGQGHMVGVLLQAQGLRRGMTEFFEGDDSTVIDGEMRLHGTGSEDYFNGGWYALKDRWDAPLSLPTHGALDYSLLFSRTGGYRFYFNDKLSFEKSLYHSIEHGSERNKWPVIYSSVAFYYSNTPPIASSSIADTKVYIPDTLMIYPHFTKVTMTDDVQLQTSWDSASVGQSFKLTVNDGALLILHPDNIPAGSYKVIVRYVAQKYGAKFSLWQRQLPLSEWIDSKSAQPVVMEKEMGDISITETNKTMTLRFNADGLHNVFHLIDLMLVKREGDRR